LACLAHRLHDVAAVAANERSVLPDRQRLADQVALHGVAAFVGEEGELFQGLDSLGHQRHAEAVAEVDDGGDDRGRLRIAAEIDDEGAVDLDLVERERLQIAQRGIARAEIVHRDAHAERLQAAQQRQTSIEVLDQHTLGDFELEPAGRKPGFEQDRMDEADKIAVHELRRRQVDGDLQRLRPQGGLATGLAQDPFAHLDDQAALFGNRDEIAGRDEAAYRMQPARQRLESDDFAVLDGRARHRLRLEVERQLAVADRDREVLMQHATIADLLVHLRLVDADRAARLLFGAEQRRAGIGKQRGSVRSVVREHRDAGGETGADRFAVDRKFPGYRLHKLLCELDPGGGLLAVDDKAEFVAGEPRHHAAARRSLDAVGNLDQELVAGRVTEHVVDFLEAIEVDREYRELFAGSGAGLDHLGQRLQEGGAVGQIGQAVVIGHVRHARFGLSAVGDVLVRLDQVFRLAALVEHGHAAGQEQPETVLGRDRMLFGEQVALLDRGLIAGDDQLGFAGMEDVGGGEPRDLLAPAAEDRLRAAVGEQIATVADTLDDQRHRDIVDHELEELLGAFELDRQRPALRDVLEQRDQEQRLVVLVASDHAVGGEHALLQTALDHELAAIMAIRRIDGGAVGGIDVGRRIGPEDLVGAIADDVIARKAREALEGAIGEDVAAVLDVLGGDADRHVVEHRFQELLGRRQLARQLALLGAIQMRPNRTAIGQGEIFDEDGPAVRQFGDQTFGSSHLSVEPIVADLEGAGGALKHRELRPGHVGRKCRARQAVDFEITLVDEHDPLPRIGHHHALVQVVEGGRDEGVAARLRTLDPAQRRMNPERDRGQEGADDDAADQDLPEHVGVERADITHRQGVGLRPGGITGRGDRDQAQKGPRKNRILAACLPILASHQSPADFSGRVSGSTGLDQVNTYPLNSKIQLKLRQLP